MAYIVNAVSRAAQGKSAEIAEALAVLVAHSRQEPGSILYIAHQSATKPDYFMFYEQFTDEAAFEAHCRTDHYRSYQNAVSSSLELVSVDTYREVPPATNSG